MSDKNNKHNLKYEEILTKFKEHSNNIDITKLPESHEKIIIEGILEALKNDKLIEAGRALYLNYKLVRMFSPIIVKLFLKKLDC